MPPTPRLITKMSLCPEYIAGVIFHSCSRKHRVYPYLAKMLVLYPLYAILRLKMRSKSSIVNFHLSEDVGNGTSLYLPSVFPQWSPPSI